MRALWASILCEQYCSFFHANSMPTLLLQETGNRFCVTSPWKKCVSVEKVHYESSLFHLCFLSTTARVCEPWITARHFFVAILFHSVVAAFAEMRYRRRVGLHWRVESLAHSILHCSVHFVPQWQRRCYASWQRRLCSHLQNYDLSKHVLETVIWPAGLSHGSSMWEVSTNV